MDLISLEDAKNRDKLFVERRSGVGKRYDDRRKDRVIERAKRHIESGFCTPEELRVLKLVFMEVLNEHGL